MEENKDSKEDVNIDEIMQEIQQQILSKKQGEGKYLPAAGGRFSPAFYEQLYRADLLQENDRVKLEVTKSPVPIIGPLIDKVRGKFHQLVLFYILQAVIPQNEFNANLFQAVALLSKELEEEAAATDDEAG